MKVIKMRCLKHETDWKRLKADWERLKVGGEGDNRGWDGYMSSPAQWTWDSERQGRLLCRSPWGHKESNKTDWLNNNKAGDSGTEEYMKQFGSADTMKNWNSQYLNGGILLSNSMKLWAMPCRASQDGWLMVESSNKKWPTGEGNGKPLQLKTPWMVWKGKKIGHWKMKSQVGRYPIYYWRSVEK